VKDADDQLYFNYIKEIVIFFYNKNISKFNLLLISRIVNIFVVGLVATLMMERNNLQS